MIDVVRPEFSPVGRGPTVRGTRGTRPTVPFPSLDFWSSLNDLNAFGACRKEEKLILDYGACLGLTF